jgi:hypothetical protein
VGRFQPEDLILAGFTEAAVNHKSGSQAQMQTVYLF